MSTLPTTSTLSHWFGSDRGIAASIGRALAGCRWVGIPFAGGMSAVAHITARSIVCNDLHKHIINLAKVTADPVLGPKLYRALRRAPFHPDVLTASQDEFWGVVRDDVLFDDEQLLNWALSYFITVWMSRGGQAGTDSEFKQKLSCRWNANGGDSNTRFRSATQSLVAWRRILRRCNFTCMDAFDFLLRCADVEGNGIYADPPWVEDGDNYRHKFTDADHARLADRLSSYCKTRVVVRYGDHPTIRRLYPRGHWHWLEQTSRAQSNGAVAEALISNHPIGSDAIVHNLSRAEKREKSS